MARLKGIYVKRVEIWQTNPFLPLEFPCTRHDSVHYPAVTCTPSSPTVDACYETSAVTVSAPGGWLQI